MEITDKLAKPISETAYLTKENTKRYRPILRFFYLQNQKMNFMLYKEDVFNQFVGKQGFEDYTLEQCDSDLSALTEWKNLIAIQDTSVAYTLEEFKNKKYRYQLTDFAVKIESLVIELENLHIEGASLEPTLIERIKDEIAQINSIANENETKVNGWWENLNADFKRLNDNYQGYIRSFYNIKMEEIAQSSKFIARKNDLVMYLREFIKALQDNSYQIEKILREVKPEVEEKILEKVWQAQSKVVRIDKLEEEVPEQEVKDRNRGKWENIKKWFIGDERRESEVQNIEEKTSEIIRKITRIANQIAESRGSINSRKAEYKKICEMFCNTNTLEEAHKLSSLVFGMKNTRHIKGNFERETDNMNSSILDELKAEIEIRPRIRAFKEKKERTIIEDKTEMKKQRIEEYLRQKEEERKLIRQYIVDGKMVIKNLPEIEPVVRKSILKWISQANQNEAKRTITEYGERVQLKIPQNGQRCELRCTDGVLDMPAYELIFET